MMMGIRVFALLGLFAAAGSAVDWKAYKPQGYVSDFAHVIDSPTKAQLENYAATVEHATGAQIALVTIPSLEGEPIDDVANTLFRSWGVGQKGKNEGILLLLVINDRRNRLEVGYGLEPILPDGFSGSILRQMRPALRQSAYGEALMAAAETIGNTIAQAKHVTLTATLPRTIRTDPGSNEIPPGALILGFIFLLFLFRLISYALGRSRGGPGGGFGGGPGGFLTGMLLGNMLSGGFRGGNSGGFGGSDSSDGGFGGFGGGDSGGGGASSDW
jgi:uncharacterized protein